MQRAADIREMRDAIATLMGNIRASPKPSVAFPSVAGIADDRWVVKCPHCGYYVLPTTKHIEIEITEKIKEHPKVVQMRKRKKWQSEYSRKDLKIERESRRIFVFCRSANCRKRVYLFEKDNAFVGRCPFCGRPICIFKRITNKEQENGNRKTWK